MKYLVERTREEIRRYGYKTATRIKVELSKKHDNKTINKLLSLLECKDIKRVEYTNTYVSKYTTRDLFYYNPKQNKTRRKRKTRKAKTKS